MLADLEDVNYHSLYSTFEEAMRKAGVLPEWRQPGETLPGAALHQRPDESKAKLSQKEQSNDRQNGSRHRGG